MRVWAGEEIIFQKNIEQIDSITFVELNTPQLIDEGTLVGEFSVAIDKKVHFSQGNLQYQRATNTWRFANNQYDFIGEGNSNITDNQYQGWIDSFGWGTGTAPILYTANDQTYSAFYDWGSNKISNGGNMPNVWSTLARSEWVYIFHERPFAETLFAFGSVNDVPGLIILPDEWSLPDGPTFNTAAQQGLEWKISSSSGVDLSYYNGTGELYTSNSYNIDEWKKMEIAGAVFLPAAGHRHVSQVDAVGTNGVYWSSTARSYEDAFNLLFNPNQIWPQLCYNRHYGLSVRLVR